MTAFNMLLTSKTGTKIVGYTLCTSLLKIPPKRGEVTLTLWDEFRRQFLNAFAKMRRKERAKLAIEPRIEGLPIAKTSVTEL